MAVENIIDAFYNACGRGDLANVQRYFCADNRELNEQGMYSAISQQHLNVAAFLLPHMKRPLTSTFHRKVVDTNNTQLFQLFYNAELDDNKNWGWWPQPTPTAEILLTNVLIACTPQNGGIIFATRFGAAKWETCVWVLNI